MTVYVIYVLSEHMLLQTQYHYHYYHPIHAVHGITVRTWALV
jgi:hypothetical protein